MKPLICLCMLLATFGTGCVVMPPLRVGAGAGGNAGDVVIRNSAAEIRRHDYSASTQLRGAFTPLLLGKTPQQRRGDLSLGWAFDWQTAGGSRREFRHGPFAEGVWFVHNISPATNQRWRYGPTASVEIRTRAPGGDETRGYGAAGGVLVELADTVTGPFFGGGWKGELALGLAARVGFRHVDGGSHGYAIVSVECRLPGVAAFVLPLPSRRTALVQ